MKQGVLIFTATFTFIDHIFTSHCIDQCDIDNDTSKFTDSYSSMYMQYIASTKKELNI